MTATMMSTAHNLRLPTRTFHISYVVALGFAQFLHIYDRREHLNGNTIHIVVYLSITPHSKIIKIDTVCIAN